MIVCQNKVVWFVVVTMYIPSYSNNLAAWRIPTDELGSLHCYYSDCGLWIMVVKNVVKGVHLHSI